MHYLIIFGILLLVIASIATFIFRFTYSAMLEDIYVHYYDSNVDNKGK